MMLSDVDTTKTVSRNRIIKTTNSGKAPPCEPQMRKKPHNPSVNDIYDKMKVIRRSLESMELSVGKHLYSKLVFDNFLSYTSNRLRTAWIYEKILQPARNWYKMNNFGIFQSLFDLACTLWGLGLRYFKEMFYPRSYAE